MDPHPGNFPILSYVLSRVPSIGPKTAAAAASTSGSSYSDFVDVDVDIEQPHAPPRQAPSDSSTSVSSSGLTQPEILGQMPHLIDSKLLGSMTRAISDVSQTRSVLKLIGERPDHETVDIAKMKLADIDAQLSRQLEEIVLSQRPVNVDIHEWRSHLAEKEKECRELADKKKRVYKSVVQLDEMHDAYEKLLTDAEKRLVKIYESAEEGAEANEDGKPKEEINEEVVGILREAYGKGMERVDLSSRKLNFLPEAFGRIPGLVVLDLSCNQLEVIPDSIAGLHNLEEFNVASNLLESLPDSIGFLQKLKVLNVSGNKLTALPNSICQCRSLVELDASFNNLLYLPTDIGFELVNLQKLLIQLNKIRSLPSSVCEMRSLRCLDVHFNELQGLPIAIGKLTNLEVLNLSSNFADLRELTETFGDLTNLRELDLSNNQINALPDTFGRLDKLTKLNLEHNPLELPPPEIVNEGVEAVKTFMAKRWIDILIEEERKSVHAVQEQGQTGWLTQGTSWLKSVSESVTGAMGSLILSPKPPKDAYLDRQL